MFGSTLLRTRKSSPHLSVSSRKSLRSAFPVFSNSSSSRSSNDCNFLWSSWRVSCRVEKIPTIAQTIRQKKLRTHWLTFSSRPFLLWISVWFKISPAWQLVAANLTRLGPSHPTLCTPSVPKYSNEELKAKELKLCEWLKRFALQSVEKVIFSLESPESKNCCTNTNLTQTQYRGTESLDLHPGLGRRCIRTPSSLDSIDDVKPFEACDFTIIRYGLFINCWSIFWMVDLYVTIVYQENKEKNNRTILPSFTQLFVLPFAGVFLPSFVQSLSHSQSMNAWRSFMISMIDLMTGETTRTFAYICDVGRHPNNPSCLRCLRFGLKTPRRASELHWSLRVGSWLSQQWRMHTLWRVACAVASAQPAGNLTQLAVLRRWIDWMILPKTA